MKRVLFSLICILTFVEIVNAETKIQYDWGKYVSYDHILNSNVFDNNLGIIYYNNSCKYVLYDTDGKEINLNNADDMDCFIMVNNQLISVYYNDEEDSFYQIIYDKDLNFIREVEVSSSFYNRFDPETALTGMSDKYYYINDFIFDRETNELVNINEVVEKHELYEDYLSYSESGNKDKADEVINEIYNEEFPRTTAILYLLLYMNNFDYSANIYDFIFDDNGNVAIVFQDRGSDEYWVDVYNSNYELLYSIDSSTNYQPYIFFRDNKLYFVELKRPYERGSVDESVSYKIVMLEYDLNGNVLNDFNLTEIIDKEYYGDGDYYGYRVISDLVLTNGGFYLLTTKPLMHPESMDPSIGETDIVDGVSPTIQKFSFIYDIETVESDNGTIVVDKDSSKSGENVIFTVQPKEGYKLDKVIVTDESGNKIEIKESTFTMPSANVTIEAVFVVENPNTSMFLKFGFAVILMVVCYYVMTLKNIKVKQYE